MIYFTNMIICSSRVTSHIIVDVGLTLGVRRLCTFVVIGRGDGTEVTRISAKMSVRPAVMDWAGGHFDDSGTPWRSDFSGLGQLELGDDVGQASDFVEGADEF